MKQPPFSVTSRIIEQVAGIAELTGRITERNNLRKNPELRRINRIKTIQGSLAIEQNTLSVEQVTAVINGKHVLAPPEDTKEVKNAYEIYDHLDKLNPCSADDLLKAHGVMLGGLTSEAGMYRERPVGVVDSESGEIIHFGTLPQYVPDLMNQLFAWLSESDTHPLIKACVFHYEFELIHPFIDGNGRIGRLWHTLIMSKWNPLFAWLPVESMICQRQQEYYKTINYCNAVCDSTKFIEFMLDTVISALEEAIDSV